MTGCMGELQNNLCNVLGGMEISPPFFLSVISRKTFPTWDWEQWNGGGCVGDCVGGCVGGCVGEMVANRRHVECG